MIFSGELSEIPNVCVDRFTLDVQHCTVYLLSHCHADHMEGLLSDGFLRRLSREASVFLYCGALSRRLLSSGRLQPLLHRVRPLAVGGPCRVSVPGSLRHPQRQELSVWAIPAGHCPGSLMFLLESSTATVLYTGDFRVAEGTLLRLRPLLTPAGALKRLHALYLDTTFLDARYARFPPRHVSARLLSDVVREWAGRGPRHAVCVHTPARYGCEYLFADVWRGCGHRVHVRAHHRALFAGVDDVEDALTDDGTSTVVHANCCQEGSGCPSLEGCRRSPLVLHVKPSAMWLRSVRGDWDSLGAIEGGLRGGRLVRLPYSSHCSFTELRDVVRSLKADRVVPCVVPAGLSLAQVHQLLADMSRAEQVPALESAPPTGAYSFTALRSRRVTRKAPSGPENDLPSPPRKELRRDD